MRYHVCLQVRNSIDIDDARRSYFENLFPLNAGGIIPVGPSLIDLEMDVNSGRGLGDVTQVFHMRSGASKRSAVAAG